MDIWYYTQEAGELATHPAVLTERRSYSSLSGAFLLALLVSQLLNINTSLSQG